MDLIAPVPIFNLYNEHWPVYTTRRALPPAKVSRGRGGEPSFVDGSLLCQGSIVSGSHVERSIVGPGSYIDHDAHVTDSIIFPGVRIASGARLHRCIIDKNARIGDNWRLRYHALTLHNQVQVNHLPYMPFPPTWPTYIPKDKLANWFEAYADAMELNVWTSTECLGGSYDRAAGR